MAQISISIKQKQMDIENRPVVAEGEGGAVRQYWEFGISRCKLVFIGSINKVL